MLIMFLFVGKRLLPRATESTAVELTGSGKKVALFMQSLIRLSSAKAIAVDNYVCVFTRYFCLFSLLLAVKL